MTDKVRKSAQEKAQEALDAAQRKVDSITKRKAAAEAQVETLKSDLEAAVATRDYVKQHPALSQPTADPKAPEAETTADPKAPEAEVVPAKSEDTLGEF